MQTITIQTQHEAALRIIENLASLDLIKVLSNEKQTHQKRSLAERLVGSISEKQAEDMREELKEMREGWERDI